VSPIHTARSKEPRAWGEGRREGKARMSPWRAVREEEEASEEEVARAAG
jgi:hypothetical protein